MEKNGVLEFFTNGKPLSTTVDSTLIYFNLVLADMCNDDDDSMLNKAVEQFKAFQLNAEAPIEAEDAMSTGSSLPSPSADSTAGFDKVYMEMQTTYNQLLQRNEDLASELDERDDALVKKDDIIASKNQEIATLVSLTANFMY